MEEHPIENGNAATLQRLIEDLKVVVRDGERLLRGHAGQWKRQAISKAHATDETIRRHPYPSIGAVFGVGVLVGLLAHELFAGGTESRQV